MKNGWPIMTLADVAESVSTGPFGTMLHKSDYVSDGIPLVNPMNIVDSQIVPSVRMLISEETRRRLSNYVLKKGDVVVARRGELGRCAVVTDVEDGWLCGTGSCFVRLSNKMDERFFALLYSSSRIKDILEQASVGTTMSNLNHGILNALPIPVPPLPEQRRIVAILDEAFAGIATAKAHAEQNLQNARAVFESELDAVFTKHGWTEKPLGEVADFKNGLNFSQNSNGQTVRVVGVGDFQNNAIVPVDDLGSVTIDGDLNEAYAIRKNDILTVRSNGSKDLVGRCMLVPAVRGIISYSGFVIRIRFDTHSIDPQFLLHFMKCSATRERLTREGGGANISNINQEKLSSLSVPLPPLNIQRQKAANLDRLQAETNRLAALYQRKLAALDELKKSLLHQAFSGQLTKDNG